MTTHFRKAFFVFFLIFTAQPSWAEDTWSEKAIRLMAEDGRVLSESFNLLKQIDNEFQYQAIEILVGDNRGDIAGKMIGILRFNNSFQVDALRIMVNDGREIGEAIHFLAEISNEFQVQAILLLTKRADMRGKLPWVLQMDNSFQVEALRSMIEDDREIGQTIASLSQISNEYQVRFIKLLIKQGVPHIGDKMPYILKMSETNAEERSLVVAYLGEVLGSYYRLRGVSYLMAHLAERRGESIVYALHIAGKPNARRFTTRQEVEAEIQFALSGPTRLQIDGLAYLKKAGYATLPILDRLKTVVTSADLRALELDFPMPRSLFLRMGHKCAFFLRRPFGLIEPTSVQSGEI